MWQGQEGPEARRPVLQLARVHLASAAPCRCRHRLCNYSAPVLRVTCEACGREGRYGLAGLIDRFGPAAALPDVLAVLAADCPRRGTGRWFSDPCGTRFPDLGR